MFSGFYDALNQRTASHEDHSPHGTPRASLDPSSPTASPRTSQADGPGYVPYQRRAKPSLEDRLRASLLAKEQKRAGLERSASGSALPAMDEHPETSHGGHKMAREKNIDATTIPLPVSPPVQATDPTPSLQGMASMVLSPSTPQIPEQAISSARESRQTDPIPSAIPPPSQPTLQIPQPGDPLSPQLTTASTESGVQELTLPPATISPADPLTGSLMELEKEQQAAALKARSARSPPPPSSPPRIPASSTKHHTSNRSFSGNRAGVPDGESFVRLEANHSLNHRPSMEQILHGNTFEWLGIDGVQSAEELKEWAEMMRQKTQTAQDEVSQLHGKMAQHDSRIEELRDMHRLELKSQSDLVEDLRHKVADAEAQVSAVQSSLTTERALLNAERSTRESLIAAERAKHSTGLADIDVLKAKLKDSETEMDKLKAIAQEEEEKRTKAISLLKTVRTKLVKAEKDRDDLQAQMNEIKEAELTGGKKGEEEMRTLRAELESVKSELERVRTEGVKEIDRVREEARLAVDKRRRELEAEIASARDAMERDLLARRGEWEIEGIAAKTAHQREVNNLNSRIATLSTSLSQIGSEKEQLFTDLQFRQSELESSRTQLESLQAQLTESNYQLRERDEQLVMVQVELSEAHRAAFSSPGTNKASLSVGPSGPEVARLLKEAESRSESRVADLRARLKTIEAERAEQEDNWSRTLAARSEEIERLRGLLTFQEKEGMKIGDYKALRDKEAAQLEERIKGVEKEKLEERRRYREIAAQLEALREGLESKDFEIADLNGRLEAVNGTVDELRGKESQLKSTNKTLRDELRKVQSSAALLERQRNPGVGFWATSSRGSVNGDGPSASSPDLTKFSGTPRPGTPTAATNGGGSGGGGKAASSAGSARSSMEVSGSVQGEEEVNMEYLRNVILQFLENEKMRPNLVRVLSHILRFTPQETRRLIAKV